MMNEARVCARGRDHRRSAERRRESVEQKLQYTIGVARRRDVTGVITTAVRRVLFNSNEFR